MWQEWVQRQKDKEKDRKHKRDKRDRDRHRTDRRDADGDGDRATGAERDKRRSEGDKVTPDVADADGERSIKRARLSGSPAVGQERGHGDKEGDMHERRDNGENGSHVEMDDKKPVRAGSGGDVEEGEL